MEGKGQVVGFLGVLGILHRLKTDKDDKLIFESCGHKVQHENCINIIKTTHKSTTMCTSVVLNFNDSRYLNVTESNSESDLSIKFDHKDVNSPENCT